MVIYKRFLVWLAVGVGREPLVEDLTLDVVLAWLDLRERGGEGVGRGLAPTSLGVERAALRALAWQVRQPDVAAGLAAARAWPTPATISAAQYQGLLEAPDRRSLPGIRDQAVLRVLGDTGIRPSELRALRVGDVLPTGQGRGRQLQVGGRRSRTVLLTASAGDALTSWLACHPLARPGADREGASQSAPLFTVIAGPTRGQSLTDTGLALVVARHAARAGIPTELARPGVLRHFWAARAAAAGIPPEWLQQLGGWVDRRQVLVYYASL
jgi:integrase